MAARVTAAAIAAGTLAGLAFCASALAQEYQAGGIHIDDAWARVTAPDMVNGNAYMEIRNEGKTPDRLVSVQSAAAARVILQSTRIETGSTGLSTIYKMEDMPGVDVPAGGKVSFAPGEYSVTFLKLKTPFTPGAQVPATLTFEKAGTVQVTFTGKIFAYPSIDQSLIEPPQIIAPH